MNLRQKAKHYKKRYENLEKMMMPTQQYYVPSDNHRVITLETSQIMDIEDYYRMSEDAECYSSKFNKLMAANLLHEILNYAEITREPFQYDKEIIRARMTVIDMSK